MLIPLLYTIHLHFRRTKYTGHMFGYYTVFLCWHGATGSRSACWGQTMQRLYLPNLCLWLLTKAHLHYWKHATTLPPPWFVMIQNDWFIPLVWWWDMTSITVEDATHLKVEGEENKSTVLTWRSVASSVRLQLPLDILENWWWNKTMGKIHAQDAHLCIWIIYRLPHPIEVVI